jgi:hypothetical protein
MGIRGGSRNVALTPFAAKDSDPSETLIPAQIDLRNGFLSDFGNWVKRPGKAEEWDLTVDEPIDFLFNFATGYAGTESGRLYRLLPNSGVTSQLTTKLSGPDRPSSLEINNKLLIFDGGTPVKIEGGESSLLGGSPPSYHFVTQVGDYVLAFLKDDFQFQWSDPNNEESWPTVNNAEVTNNGTIKNAKQINDRLYIFKTSDIEVWGLVGGTSPFQRTPGSRIVKGTLASDSVVQANDTLFWLAPNFHFYTLGQGLRIISENYQKRIRDLDFPDKIYGFDCPLENCIRWIAPDNGICFRYDYINDVFSEDNEYFDGAWQRLGFNSYMEVGNKAYFGSHAFDGKIYSWSFDNKDDDGNPIRVFRRLRVRATEEGNAAAWRRVRFRFKDTSDEDGFEPTFFYRYRPDGGVMGISGKWSDWVKVSKNEFSPWYDDMDLGVAREMEFDLAELDAEDFLLTDMTVTITPFGV